MARCLIMNSLVIETEHLAHNIKAIQKFIERSTDGDRYKPAKIIAVIKANGYGLGLVEYTKFLIDNGINFFAVSSLEDAVSLRTGGITSEILMLSPSAIKEEMEALIENDIIVTLSSREDILVAEEIAKEKGIKVKAHLKIDTGFGRYGFIYTNISQLVHILKKTSQIEILGTYSHFSVSFFDDEYTKVQFERFIRSIKTLKSNGIETGMLHICNSSAFLKFKYMHLDAVRIGSAFLGRLPFQNQLGLKKIGYMESRVTEVKQVPKGFNIGYSNTYRTKRSTRIAVIPCGFMSGINMSNEEDMYRPVDKMRYVLRDVKSFFTKQTRYVQINGENFEILGRVGTCHIVCDITNSNIKPGQTAVLAVNPKFVDSSIKRVFR